MNNKIEEAKRKKGLLIAQAKRAEASKTIHETLAGINESAAFSTFDRMAEKVEALEAQAQASEELATEYNTGNSLEDEIGKLKPTVSNNDALAALKAKMGKGPAPAEQAYDSSYNNNTATAGKSLANVSSWDDL